MWRSMRLDVGDETTYVSRMTEMGKTSKRQEIERALGKIGGEFLAGSSFEDETPDPEFSESEPAAPPTRQ